MGVTKYTGPSDVNLRSSMLPITGMPTSKGRVTDYLLQKTHFLQENENKNEIQNFTGQDLNTLCKWRKVSGLPEPWNSVLPQYRLGIYEIK